MTDKLHRSVVSLLTNYVPQAFFVSVISVSAGRLNADGEQSETESLLHALQICLCLLKVTVRNKGNTEEGEL